MQTQLDTGYAPETWAFDGEVTRVFDDMLARSIPQLDVMRKAVLDVACRFRQPGTEIVDLGSSRGSAFDPLLDKFGATNHYVLVETSPPMLEILHQKYDTWNERGKLITILDMDLRDEFPIARASVVQSVLTLMFVPIECRQQVVQSVYDCLIDGGAFVIVEKVLGATATIDRLLVDLYYQKKQDSGYTQEEIERKRLSLQGQLVPVTASWNEELLRQAGFRQVDCFWRWMNFVAWVAIK
jgi:tRNA (cmo5U34)-methyltransferase